MKRILAPAIGLAAASLAIAGCNDDIFVPEGGSVVAGTVAGVYIGTLGSDPGGATEFEAIVLDDGSFWTFYGSVSASAFTPNGFARGSGDAADGLFASSTATDYGFTPPADLSLQGDYDTDAATFVGSYTTVAGTTTFDGGPLDFSDYDFSAAADLALVAGMWDVEDGDGVMYTLDVAVDGTFDLAEAGGGCTGSGTITPAGSGRNVFDVSLSYDNVVDCVYAGGATAGILVTYSITALTTDQLLLGVNSGADFGMALAGTRPTP